MLEILRHSPYSKRKEFALNVNVDCFLYCLSGGMCLFHLQMRGVNMLLKLDMDNGDTTNLILSHYLESILEHSQTCDDLICPVSYCQKCSEW